MTKEITAALCKFIKEVGTIVETETAKIPTKSGSGFQYKYADLSKVLKVVNPALANNGLFVSTAHPIKFKDTVENSIKSQLEYPDSIKSIMDREKSAKTMKSYSELKEYLMHKD